MKSTAVAIANRVEYIHCRKVLTHRGKQNNTKQDGETHDAATQPFQCSILETDNARVAGVSERAQRGRTTKPFNRASYARRNISVTSTSNIRNFESLTNDE